ncbi:MAG: type II secretion system inner membrane protein GspF [Pseudohongiellaceae bacterium]
MAAFSFQALDCAGHKVKGVLDGDSERQVRNLLRNRALKPLAISPVAAAADTATGGLARRWTRSTRLSAAERALVTRQLASLLRSGLPVVESLQVTAQQSSRPALQGLLLDVRSRVQEGQSLAQALAQQGSAFDTMYCAMVRAGESSGYLGEVLERLAEHAESGQQLQQRLQMAMIYPLALLSVAVAVVSLLMVFVVPSLTRIFVNSGQELPALTQGLITLSQFFSSIWALLGLAGLALLIIIIRQRLREITRRRRWHGLLLRLPLLGSILLQADSARFASTLSILTSSGVPLLDALRIASRVLKNLVIYKRSQEVAVALQQGSSLTRALRNADIFPPLLVSMVASGEANGSLAEQLAYAAANQNRELEMKLTTTMALLEPLTILIMGGLVTLIMLAILLPIFSLNTLV